MGRALDGAHVAADDHQVGLFGKGGHAFEKRDKVLLRPRPRDGDRGQRPHRRRAFGREVSERERERAPACVFGGHPREVEVNLLHRHVGAGDGVRAVVIPRGSIVLACGDRNTLRGEIGRDQLEEPGLAGARN